MPAKDRARARECERRYRQSEKGRQKRAEYEKRRRAENPDHAARCRARVRSWAERNPEYAKEWKRENAHLVLFYGAKQRALKGGLDFDISSEDIVIPKKCPWLGLKLEAGGGKRPNSPSLDRVDNAKGYVKGNIEVISWRANDLKRTATFDELIAMGKRASKLKGKTR